MSQATQSRPWLCHHCIRILQRQPNYAARGLQGASRAQKRLRSDSAASERQAIPLSGYYAELLKHPVPRTSSTEPSRPTTPKPPERSQKEETIARARVVFGSRLAGPAERVDELRAKSSLIAGVLVPPKPTEPDNCCMSGCVNCVWDQYRDELEDWAAKSAEARIKLLAQKQSSHSEGGPAKKEGVPTHVATSMDDDGGGSETNWAPAPKSNDEDLFRGIPVGIREFMRTEKILKERLKASDGAATLQSP